MNNAMRHIKFSDTGCWEWTGCSLPKGYGKLRRENKDWLAHRYFYTKCVGEIPDGFVVMHKCDNPKCCNPDHLDVGTYADNQRDSISKGRAYKGPKPWVSKGQDNYAAKIKNDDVKTIRHLFFAERRTLKEIGDFFGIAFQTVSKIVNRHSWRHT